MAGGFTDNYAGPVVDPFRIRAGDGRIYFDVLQGPRGIIAFYEKLLDFLDYLVNQERKSRDPAVKAYWAGNVALCDRALRTFRADMARIGADTATYASARIRSHIDRSAVRPRASGALKGAIFSAPIHRRLETGEVGIGEMSALSRVPYWDAQEFGTDAHVGRIVHGWFMPGRVRPDPSQFRQHPVFQAGKGGRMLIQNAIDGRGFLRQGVEDAGHFRHQQVNAAVAKVSATLNLIAQGQAPAPRPSSGTRTPRRRRP